MYAKTLLCKHGFAKTLLENREMVLVWLPFLYKSIPHTQLVDIKMAQMDEPPICQPAIYLHSPCLHGDIMMLAMYLVSNNDINIVWLAA